ncbi:DNA-binding protein YbiB [Variovorax sp. PCZ-1]|uniref:DNA-binding protein YbiB n=1 Tax=Variovorax sp. PCZ-1 TaxID=2835533 RepID=UPI001BD00012|nr:DNA-binding protein YbiB [Variovorax sp. PCZ-1]MBS7806815.1 DNA-binding protein YbiB [Variovorax sp. PCZ-1]
MSIAKYIKEIGRGKEGARSLSREQAADLLGQVLDGAVSDLEIGAFCIAMRVKGETPQEMAGFLDAMAQRIRPVQSAHPIVVIPSYNGARKLPGLTTLLAGLLAREGAQRGFTVLVHGCTTEAARVPTQDVYTSVFAEFLKQKQHIARIESAQDATELIVDECSMHSGIPLFVPTTQLSPSLQRLLDVRRSIGLRNPAHSLVKLMNPTNRRDALIVTSYTHPEYLHSMTETLQLTGSHAMLLRGTEGESVADARRRPRMDGFIHGQPLALCEVQEGSLSQLPDLPACDAASTASYTQQVLTGEKSVPAPITAQVEHILHLMSRIEKAS